LQHVNSYFPASEVNSDSIFRFYAYKYKYVGKHRVLEKEMRINGTIALDNHKLNMG
jgi:hypothetical protein